MAYEQLRLRSVAPAITDSSVKLSKDAMAEQDEGKKQALTSKRTKLLHGSKALQTYANTTLTDGNSDYMRLLAGPLAAAQAARPAAPAPAPVPAPAPAPAPNFTPGTKTSEETMSYRQHAGKARLNFDPATASEDESLGVLYDTIKRHEKDSEFDPEELARLKREFTQRRLRQINAQQQAPAPAAPKPKKKWWQFWK